MPDLTDKRLDLIVVCPDAKTMTAFDTWESTLKTDEKANFSIVADKYIVSAPDPENLLTETRDAFVALVDTEAESMTSVVRLQFDGVTFAAIVMLVHKPVEEPK